MRGKYSISSKNKYQKIRRSAMKKRHFSRRNVNEYFHRKNKSNTWQNKVVFLFFLFIFLYIIYFLFFSNYFKINQIIIEGNEEIPSWELKERCYDLLDQHKFLVFKNDNYFLFNTEDLKEKLAKDYLLEELRIEKKYFSTIFIYLKEKPHKLFYIIDDNSFLIDENGMVISRLDYQEIVPDDSESRRDKGKIILKEIPEQLITNQEKIDEQEEKIVKDNELYNNTNSTSTVFVWDNTNEGMIVKEVDIIEPQIEDVYPNFPEIGSKIFSSDMVRKILYLDANYNHKFGENRDYYEFKDKNPDSLIMITKENFKIFFKLNEAIDSQLSNLYRYLIEEDNSTENIEYIDLRQNNQIIIK